MTTLSHLELFVLKCINGGLTQHDHLVLFVLKGLSDRLAQHDHLVLFVITCLSGGLAQHDYLLFPLLRPAPRSNLVNLICELESMLLFYQELSQD